MRRARATWVVTTWLSLLPSLVSAQAPPPLWFDLVPGPYHPAFTVEYLVDMARSWCDTDDPACVVPGRPVRTFVWSPAERVTGTPMTLGDLLAIEPDDSRLAPYDASIDRRAESTFSRQFFGDERRRLAERLRAETTWSFRDATPARGPFPLVVHSLGRNDYQLESTVLWEYLASHGFVVAVVPQVPATSAGEGLAFTAEDLLVQADDVAYVVSQMSSWGQVEGSRYGIIGHSSGAVVAWLQAERDPDLAAVVSLDGSITTRDGRELLEPLGWPRRPVRAAVLSIYVREKALDLWALDRGVGLDRYDVAVDQAIHFDFQNWPLYNALYGVDEPRSAAVRDRERARDVFLASVTLSERFLTGLLLGDPTARRELHQGPYPTAFEDGGAIVTAIPAR